MPEVTFAAALQNHVPCPPALVHGRTVRAALEAAFAAAPRLKGYVLDDQGDLRHHVAVFVGGRSIGGTAGLDEPIDAHAKVHVIQALSGG